MHHIPPRVRDVIQVVAIETGVSVDDILSRSHKRQHREARMEAMRWVRAMRWGAVGSPSYPMIGRWFQRDHTTVINACKQERREEQPSLFEGIAA